MKYMSGRQTEKLKKKSKGLSPNFTSILSAFKLINYYST